MKLLVIIAIIFAAIRGDASNPLPASTNLAVLDFNGDGLIEFTYRAVVASQFDFAVVSSSLLPRSGSSILSASSSAPLFELDAEVSISSVGYTNPLTGSYILPVSSYVAQLDPPAGVWYFFPGGGLSYTGEKLEIFVGVLVSWNDEAHSGWIRLTRPDLDPENLFSVSGFDWNPIPGAPIRAGLPPEIPVATEVLPEDGGIRLSWAAGVSHWILESTRSLSAPVVWEPYPAGGTYADVPPEDADRFFRLRRPE